MKQFLLMALMCSSFSSFASAKFENLPTLTATFKTRQSCEEWKARMKRSYDRIDFFEDKCTLEATKEYGPRGGMVTKKVYKGTLSINIFQVIQTR